MSTNTQHTQMHWLCQSGASKLLCAGELREASESLGTVLLWAADPWLTECGCLDQSAGSAANTQPGTRELLSKQWVRATGCNMQPQTWTQSGACLQKKHGTHADCDSDNTAESNNASEHSFFSSVLSYTHYDIFRIKQTSQVNRQ